MDKMPEEEIIKKQKHAEKIILDMAFKRELINFSTVSKATHIPRRHLYQDNYLRELIQQAQVPQMTLQKAMLEISSLRVQLYILVSFFMDSIAAEVPEDQ